MGAIVKPFFPVVLAVLALAGCEEAEFEVSPLATSLDGVPFSTYQCWDGRLAQIAWNEEEATIRLRGRNIATRYTPTEEGVVYTGGGLIMIVQGSEVLIASESETDESGRVIGLRCRYQSGG